MMETKFTPGPWEVLREDKPRVRSLIMGSDLGQGCIAECFCHSGGDEPETRKANAHLIAASPEGYHSNEELVAAIGKLLAGEPVRNLDEIIVRANNYLAKARGKHD